VALWLGHRTCDRGIMCSSASQVVIKQHLYLYVPMVWRFEYQTRGNFQVAVQISHLQVSLSSWYPSACSNQLSLLPSVGWEMSSRLWATGWMLSVADWGGGLSAGCTAGPIVSWCRQWMAA